MANLFGKPVTPPRDTQRGRLYDAERKAYARMNGGAAFTRTIPNGDLQAWVDAALDKPGVRSRWRGAKVTVTLKRGGSAYGYGYGGSTGRISLPLFARNPQVMLHEIAHVLTPNGYAVHGPEYAGVYLTLVRYVLGADAARTLREEFRAAKVRVSMAAVPEPQKGVPSRAKRAARARAKAAEPPGIGQAADAADVIRRAAKAGLFGEAGSKQRRRALDVARVLADRPKVATLRQAG